MIDPIREAVLEVACDGGGWETVWPVPESASVRLDDGGGHLLAGATITSWSV